MTCSKRSLAFCDLFKMLTCLSVSGSGFSRQRGVAENMRTTSAFDLNVGQGGSHIAGVDWPRGLKTVEFGLCFNRSIAGFQWPNGLKTMDFGNRFNQSITGVRWPNGLETERLKTMDFGNRFNQPITRVRWS